MSLKIYRVNAEYCNYLRAYDARVPLNDSNKKRRPFIGIVLSIRNFNYFAPLSSPKPKFLKMKNQIDMLKIENGRLGVINFNNMIPVLDSALEPVDLKVYQTDTDEDKRYKFLLRDQRDWCTLNNSKIIKRAERLYQVIISRKANKELSKRCCDFAVLEDNIAMYEACMGSGERNRHGASCV